VAQATEHSGFSISYSFSVQPTMGFGKPVHSPLIADNSVHSPVLYKLGG
jgi:hypothetical protein